MKLDRLKNKTSVADLSSSKHTFLFWPAMKKQSFHLHDWNKKMLSKTLVKRRQNVIQASYKTHYLW